MMTDEDNSLLSGVMNTITAMLKVQGEIASAAVESVGTPDNDHSDQPVVIALMSTSTALGAVASWFVDKRVDNLMRLTAMIGKIITTDMVKEGERPEVVENINKACLNAMAVAARMSVHSRSE